MRAAAADRVDLEHMLARGSSVWGDLRGATVFMTGGTGFVGTWLVEAFVAANVAHALGARLVLLSRDPARFTAQAPHLGGDAAVTFVQGDAVDFAPPAGPIDYVVHAATEALFPADERSPLSIVERDLAATRRVLDLAHERGTRRVLFTSSGAVYGPQSGTAERVSEDDPAAPDVMTARAAYGESKRLSEFACASYGRVFGFDAVVARLFAFSGPGIALDGGYAIGNFVRDALAGGPIRVGGDGTAVRSYLYAADLAVWLWTMLLRGTTGRAYNVGSPHAVTIRALAETVARVVAPGCGVEIAGLPAPGAAPSRYVPDTARARDELGLEPWIDLDEGIRRMAAAHRG